MEEKEYKIIDNYKDVAKRMLRLSFPTLRDVEIEEALDYSVQKRFKNTPAKIFNNYSDTTVQSNIADICDYILDRKPIITSYGVLFSRHGVKPNPITKLLKTFMEGRDEYKKIMFQYPKGSEDFERYNLLQLLSKVDAK